MHANDTHTQELLHRGSFADGQADPELYPCDSQVGTFGEVDTNADDLDLGTFATGQDDLSDYPGDDDEGTFAEDDVRA